MGYSLFLACLLLATERGLERWVVVVMWRSELLLCCAPTGLQISARLWGSAVGIFALISPRGVGDKTSTVHCQHPRSVGFACFQAAITFASKMKLKRSWRQVQAASDGAASLFFSSIDQLHASLPYATVRRRHARAEAMGFMRLISFII